MTRTRRAKLGGTLAVLMATSAARACPMCRDGVRAEQRPTSAPADGTPATASLDFNGSIYAMLGVTAIVGAALARAIVRATRQR